MSTRVPTRWHNVVREQLASAVQRVERADRYVADGDGSRAMQEVYPAVVTLATIGVWMDAPPWEHTLSAEDMHQRVQEQFPSLFAALVELDLQQVLTRPWRAEDAAVYVQDAREHLARTAEAVDSWLGTP